MSANFHYCHLRDFCIETFCIETASPFKPDKSVNRQADCICRWRDNKPLPRMLTGEAALGQKVIFAAN